MTEPDRSPALRDGPLRPRRIGLLAGLVLLLAGPPALAASADGTLGGRLRVRTADVTESVLAERRTTTGVVRAWRAATIAAETPGRIVERLVEPGHVAEAGELLLRTDPRRVEAGLRQARATHAARRVDVADAEQDLERAQRLFRENAISEDTVDDRRFALERARAQLDVAAAALADAERQVADASVRAPFAGKVEAVHVQLGDYVNVGTPVALLSDFSRARVVSGVGSADVGRISAGETVEISFADLGGLRLPATVTSVGSMRDPRGGTFPVELVLDGPAVGQLRDGLVATVAWGTGADGALPTIPTGAVVRRDGRLVAYVIDDGVAHERGIRTGRSDGDRIIVHEGLAPGERVVVEGHFALRDGARVEVAPEGAR
jgi:membrane fusion protein (multidrug efflux system)